MLKKLSKKHGKTFSRANVTSILASVVDFTLLTTLVEIAHMYYVKAVALGAVAGAITNFLLNRHWAFHEPGTTKHPIHHQTFRYALVSGGSLVLNTSLVFYFTEFAHIGYLGSKIIVALLVGWLWNYPLHHYFVFAPASKTSKNEKIDGDKI